MTEAGRAGRPAAPRSVFGRGRGGRAAVALLIGSACAAGEVGFAQPPAPSGSVRPSGAADAATTTAEGERIVRIASSGQRVQVVERTGKVVALGDRISKVENFDPDVLDVTAVDSRNVRVFGKVPGVTTMTLVDEHDAVWNVDVLVTGDVAHLQEMLTRMFPTATIEAVEVKDSVVLRGWVTEPAQITEIVEIAEQFYPRVLNQMKVGCVQQVMLKVKVMEVQRSKLRQLGFNFLINGQNGFGSVTPGSMTTVTGIGGGASVAPASLANPTAIFGVLRPDFGFLGFVEALKQENLLKILAEPDVVTMNGRPANLLSGGEFPILVPNGLGTVGVQFKPFGVRLEAVPLVLSSNRVRVELQSEVSDRDTNNSVQLQGFTVPALTQRRVNTQVELNFGETLVIAGLINQSQSATISKIPVLGEIPYVGMLFSRKRYVEGETELVITVTPELVAPMTPDQIPPGGPGLFTDAPTGRELGVFGLIEVPSYGPRCAGSACPPMPTYEPFHPVGPEHVPPYALPQGPFPPGAYGPPGMIAPPGALPPGDMTYPAGPTVVPPTPADPPADWAPPIQPSPTETSPFEASPAADAVIPPAPVPSTSATGAAAGGPTARTAGRSTRPGAVAPAGYSKPASPGTGRPGLIGPRPTSPRS